MACHLCPGAPGSGARRYRGGPTFDDAGEDDHGGVRQSHPKVGVPFHDPPGMAQIFGGEQLELIGATCDLVKNCHLRLVANPRGNEVVQLGEDERRDNAWRCRRDQGRDGTAMQRFVGVERGCTARLCPARSPDAETLQSAIDVLGDRRTGRAEQREPGCRRRPFARQP